ncbi:hypothetical protein B0G69_3732 [Paraburkholderia sp. RAU2J]|uniref:hypothetical protein n=1 Tax=Paraburkholderia sp. RAU2J TaxID=1938810 RepID=UPI000EB29480|nr:hypothetical protein [Paraburkholderia sp. RAU2J]RKT20436.1 hypothetical protein B0G69_3732 [Paraburkholderia sp. RAU2J]
MDSLSANDTAGYLPGSAQALRQRQVLHLLLADATNDVEVVSRELSLRDEMRERLRRALDRMVCAQSVLESVGTDASATTTDAPEAELRMRETVELLAWQWPEDYPDGAVEWQLVKQRRKSL